jgi:dimethylargininase
MAIALTRAVPYSIVECELTHIGREPIEIARAIDQHARYEQSLAALGYTVQRLPALPQLPDSAFVEDAAVVLPELAILARPGARSRRPEVRTVAEALRPYRPLACIEPPGTLDGGDVLHIDATLYVGQSSRTNVHGIRQLGDLVAAFGYSVRPVQLAGCLHLKSAVTRIGESLVLLNPDWVDASSFDELNRIDVHPAEPFAANALLAGDCVIHPAACTRTRRRLEQRGIRVYPVEADELAKAEAGVTCYSILFTAAPDVSWSSRLQPELEEMRGVIHNGLSDAENRLCENGPEGIRSPAAPDRYATSSLDRGADDRRV